MSLKPRLARCCRIIKGTIVAALIAWLVWFGVTRWNGAPADPRGAYSGAEPRPASNQALDRTPELLHALRLLPAEGLQFTLPPPPAGKAWFRGETTVSLQDALSEACCGIWSREDRPTLQLLVDLLETPGVRQALAELSAIPPGGFNRDEIGYDSLGVARGLLMARARYRHAELKDVGGAIDDLLACYRVAALCYETNRTFAGTFADSTELLVHHELCQLTHEQTLSPQEAASIQEGFLERLPPRQVMWTHEIQRRIAWLRGWLDLAYTSNSEGDGWLVLSRVSPYNLALGTQWRPINSPSGGGWNLLSPLFNDRCAVSAKIARLEKSWTAVRNRPYAGAYTQLRELYARNAFSYLDGPLAAKAPFQCWEMVRYHARLYALVAHRGGVVINVALNRYRAEHGEYPVSLAELTVAYLQEVPRDPFDGRTLRYRRLTPLEYALYSVGPDQHDDGGSDLPKLLSGDLSPWKGDLVLHYPRPAPKKEPRLVEVSP